jgi:hypothetical protein
MPLILFQFKIFHSLKDRKKHTQEHLRYTVLFFHFLVDIIAKPLHIRAAKIIDFFND